MLFRAFERLIRAKQSRVYLDHAAATPMREEVRDAMRPYFTEHFGNPSAIHSEGQRAHDAIEEARTSIARMLSVRPGGVYFTGSGTEANNLALYGFVRQLIERTGRQYTDIAIISTKTEHPSVARVLEDLAVHGVDVRYIAVDETGQIDEAEFTSKLSRKVALVTFAYANSEIGVVQQVKQLTRAVKKYNAAHGTSIYTHLDAAQAPLWLPIEMDACGVDLMSLDSGKFYGPKGVGVLAARHGIQLRGLLLGGGQEGGVRAGTENTPLIVGCAKALALAVEGRSARSAAVAALRDDMIEQLTGTIDGCVLNGSHEHRISNNVNISIPGIDTEFAVVTLDKNGVACSTKSACGGADSSGSEVVRTISADDKRAASTLRFTLGEDTTRAEIDRVVAILTEHVHKMRIFHSTLSR